MDELDPLAQLKDIHLPPAISWWPLAPGWYAFIIFGLFLAYLIFRYVYKRQNYALAKKQALMLLADYEKQYEKEYNASLISAQISQLVRRVALAYYPRKEVAGLQGEAWLNFLNQTSKKLDFSSLRDMLLHVPFKKEEQTNLKPLFKLVKAWIKQRRGHVRAR